MQQIPGLYILKAEGKGRGVYTAGDIFEGSTIEVCPLIIIPEEQVETIHKTKLHDYYFRWGTDQKQAAILLGYGSLYNHSNEPNARAILLDADNEILIESIRTINSGEEITIDYFDDESAKEHVWFDIK